MTTRTFIRQARLLDPASGLDEVGDLMIEDGRIAARAPALGLAPDTEIIDGSGLCLAPGLVDMRVQLREPGAEHQETMQTGAAAAAAGGVTTLVALPTTRPVIDDVALVEFVARRSRDIGLVNIRTYAAATQGLRGQELTEMGLLAAGGALGFTDGTAAIAEARVMRRALSYARTFDQLILQHPEEPSLAAGGAMNEGEIATRLGLHGIPAA
ncbi:MAG TPA: dihydroorotase, partial [Stellaceae bacterium]|nr:dihydroorotase [Stellaceae bacterium]